MIALENVHWKNDLIMNARTVSLISEQDLILNENDEMYFSKNDEDMTLFLVLDLMSEVIVWEVPWRSSTWKSNDSSDHDL